MRPRRERATAGRELLLDNDDLSDIESQSHVSSSSSSAASRKSNTTSDCTSPGLRKIPVGMNFSDEVATQMTKEYGLIPIRASSLEYHLHPHLAVQRNMCEIRALSEIRKMHGREIQVVDVGSGARRHAKSKIHCLCPYLQPGDAERLNSAIRNGNTVCKHTLQTCQCVTPGVLLFVHSAYYFSVEELVKHIRSSVAQEAYVVGHLFEEAYGAFAHGEGGYRFDLSSVDDWVITKVVGNHHEYRHPPLPWDGKEARHGDAVLDVEIITKMGDTYLWRVRVADRPATSDPPVDWRAAVVDHTHMGVIHIPGFDAITRQALSANDRVEVQVDHVYGRYGDLWTHTSNGRVYMPRGAIEEIAGDIARKVRDPALMADVVYKMKAVMKKSRLPAGARLDAITIGSALAFNINVHNEVDTQATIVNRYSNLWKLHALLHNMTPVKATTWITLVIYLIVFVLWFVLVLVFDFQMPVDDDGRAAIACLLLVPPAVLWIVLVVRYCVARHQARRTADNWSRTLYTEAVTSHITGSTAQPLLTRFPAYPGLRAPCIPPGCGSVEVGEDPRPPKHPGRVKTPLTLDGIGIAETVPAVPRVDQDAEMTAITLRMLTAQTNVNPDAFARYRDMQGEAARLLMDIRLTGSATMHTDWINQAKFPLNVRQKFLKAWGKADQGESIPKKGVFNAFVKFEKMKSVGMTDIEGLKTRLINGPPDAVKVAVGPWTARLYSALIDVWDGIKCHVCYASGKTPDEIGRVCDRYAQSVGGWENVVAVWDDCTAYDSTLENELLSTRDTVYPAVGFPRQTMAWMHSVSPVGVTPHGLKYDLGKKTLMDINGKPYDVDMVKLRSGELDTGLIGTIVNALAHESGLPADMSYLMLVCGDDNLVLTRKDTFDEKVAHNLKSHLEALGLKPTQGISERRCDWEFCSKLFWEGRDPKTGVVQTVLGPKPARWLHRIGWTLNGPTEPNFREVMVSASQDVSHIPLLHEYVTKGLELSRNQRSRGRTWSEMKHVSKSYECVQANMSMLYDRYGIGEEQVIEFRTTLRDIIAPGTVISVPWIEAAAKRDEE